MSIRLAQVINILMKQNQAFKQISNPVKHADVLVAKIINWNNVITAGYEL